MALADTLRLERTQRAWSQQHLADASGVSLRTVQRAERGDPVAGETLLALAAALDVDVQALVVARQQAVATAAHVPPVDDPYRRLRFDPERVAWMGLFVASPVLWFALGLAVRALTGWGGLLPPGVQAGANGVALPALLASDAAKGFLDGMAFAGVLANAFAAVVRRDARFNAAVAALIVAALAVLVVLA